MKGSKEPATFRFLGPLLAAIAIALSGCGQSVPPTTYTPLYENPSYTATLSFQNGGTGENYHDPMIPVSVGGSGAISVMFDTGSVGLHVLKTALDAAHASYPSSGQSIVAAYGSNQGQCRWYGYSAYGSITVDSIPLTQSAKFDVITSVKNCGPALSSINGILGVRPGLPYSTDDQALPNPAQFLVGNLSTGFIASLYKTPPTVTFGLPSPLPADFAYVQPTVQNSSSVPGGTYWAPLPATSSNDDEGALGWCFKVVQWVGSSGATPLTFTTCRNFVVTDSGGEDGQIYVYGTPPAWFPAPNIWNANLVSGAPPFGTEIEATLNGTSFTWDLPLAQIPDMCEGYNNLQVYFGNTLNSQIENNFGLNLFLGADVMYDFRDPQFGVRQITTEPTPKFC